jgi:dihydroorotate dehydrogenase electron transfer subunit
MPFDVHAAVLENRRLSPDYSVLVLDAPEIARAALPGQFVMLKQPGCEPLLRRPFSIFEVVRADSSRPTGISILNKRVGMATRQIYDAAPGQHVECLGPLGRPFSVPGRGESAWMVAGGVGLAPFATLAEALAASGAQMTLFYGGRSASDLYYVEFFESLGARVVLATEDGTRGARGRITAPLDEHLREAAPGVPISLFACGPEPMLAAVARLAARHQRRCEVSVERVMGCGLGGCYSCVIPVRGGDGRAHFVRSCIGGPVFDASAIVWDGA